MNPADDITVERLEDQITWYDKRSRYCQRMFKTLWVVEIAAGAVIAGSAAIAIPPVATSALGMAIVLLEGVQQLNQYQHNWITYRSTCESLKHEKFLFGACAGPYAAAADAKILLAERIEGLVSQEHAKWVSGQAEGKKSK
jgi:hypothetical protein